VLKLIHRHTATFNLMPQRSTKSAKWFSDFLGFLCLFVAKKLPEVHHINLKVTVAVALEGEL
jgi:hypothetical protein